MRCSGVEPDAISNTVLLGSSDMAALPVLYGSHFTITAGVTHYRVEYCLTE